MAFSATRQLSVAFFVSGRIFDFLSYAWGTKTITYNVRKDNLVFSFEQNVSKRFLAHTKKAEGWFLKNSFPDTQAEALY
jgi:hypothetical protein